MEHMHNVLALLADHPVAKVHVQTILVEMEMSLKGLESDAVSSEVIASQVKLFEERIEAVIDNALGEKSSEGDKESDDIIESLDEGPCELSEEEEAAKRAADARIQARIQLAVEVSKKEVVRIRARGEDDRYILEEEQRLEETIDLIVSAHVETLRAAKDPSPFRTMSVEQRTAADDDIAWVEAQFTRIHVEETSSSGSLLEKLKVKHAFFGAELEGILQMLEPKFDEKIKEALRLEQKEKRTKEKADAALSKHIGKQERKNNRQAELDAQRKADHDARCKERQLERLKRRLHTLQDGTTIHHEISRVEDELWLSSEINANKAREVAAQAKQRMLKRRADFK
jgi:hypothetical protein